MRKKFKWKLPEIGLTLCRWISETLDVQALSLYSNVTTNQYLEPVLQPALYVNTA